MSVIIKEKKIEISKEVDVLVVGGGPAGIGAAVSAAREGNSVLLLEKRAFLGGNITASYVETCNWFLYKTQFTEYGLYKELVEKYTAKYGRSDDVRVDSPFRFSSEYFKVFLDEFMKTEKVEVLLYSFVNDVVLNDKKITAAIIQTKNGPVAVAAKVIIDCTGDGDVAYAAGVPFNQGRDGDHFCQPGTLNFRITGLDPKHISEMDKKLKEYKKQFSKDYLDGKLNLSCKRKDLPMGRLTAAGQIASINYACSYKIDPTSNIDLTKGEQECRQYIMELIPYMKKTFPGFENIELTSFAPEIGFRDSRRIEGLYELTVDDIENDVKFEDAICRFPRMYDMLAPDGNMEGDGSLASAALSGHIYIDIGENDKRSFQIPYRSLIPKNIDNLLVAGRCISATHVAESNIRAIYACMLTGQAAGTAACISIDSNMSIPKNINVKHLQKKLINQNIEI